MTPTIKAIIGLGNPGHQFSNTRHNIGFAVVDALAEQHGAVWQAGQHCVKTTIMLHGNPVLLVKPQTFMNSSGDVIPFLKKQGIQEQNILVVHDELEKPFGKVAIKQSGSARGHNGLRSIIQHAGPDFYRLRVGIGRPEHSADVPRYVLEKFSEPRAQVEKMVDAAIALLESFCGS